MNSGIGQLSSKLNDIASVTYRWDKDESQPAVGANPLMATNMYIVRRLGSLYTQSIQPQHTARPISPSIIAKLLQTCLTSIRQRHTTLRHNPTRQTSRPASISPKIPNLHTIRHHRHRIRHVILQPRRALPGIKRVIRVRQIYDSQRIGIVTAEERRAHVQSLGQERVNRWNGGHAR